MTNTNTEWEKRGERDGCEQWGIKGDPTFIEVPKSLMDKSYQEGVAGERERIANEIWERLLLIGNVDASTFVQAIKRLYEDLTPTNTV